MIDIDQARDALYSLYAQSLGNDYANEDETRGWKTLVDMALDELEERRMPQAKETEE